MQTLSTIQLPFLVWLICAIWLLCFGCGVALRFMRNRLRRERHRLDRQLNRYNSTYKDDYDFYNGF